MLYRKSSKYWYLSLLSILLLLLGWLLLTTNDFIKPIFLPSPFDTAKALWSFLISGEFAKALVVSFVRIGVASVLAVIIGGAVGLLMGVSRKAEALLNPLTQPLRYLPITAIIPILLLWFGIGETMKVAFLFLGIAFYFIPLVKDAVRTTPQELIDVAKSYGAKGWPLVHQVFLPHAMPRIMDGLIVINGIGWTYVILAEIINARNGLGYLINIAGRLQRSDKVFAGLILISAVAIISDHILRYIRDKKFFW